VSIGFELSEFDKMISQLERNGADTKQIAETVLNAGSIPAVEAFTPNVPFDDETPQERHPYEHARNTVTVSKTKTAKKTRNRYRLIEAKTTKKDADGKVVPYLYFRENGSSKSPAKPWIEKAYRAAQAAAVEPMKEAFNQEFDKHMGG
jgi:HK97 gp10 family phage protein